MEKEYLTWRQAKFEMMKGKVYSPCAGDHDYYQIGPDDNLYGFGSGDDTLYRIDGDELIEAQSTKWYWISDTPFIKDWMNRGSRKAETHVSKLGVTEDVIQKAYAGIKR